MLVIANSADPDLGYVGERLTELGFRVTRCWRDDATSLEDARAAAELPETALVLSLGSEWSVHDPALQTTVEAEADLLRTALAHRAGLLGLCYGGQILAHAFGGSVVKAEAGEIGWFSPAADGPHDSGPLAELGAQVCSGPWLEWHGDRFDPPPGAQVLGRTAAAVQAFALPGVLGLQFHPEGTFAMVARWAAGARDDLARQGLDANELIERTEREVVGSRARAHALVDSFLASLPANFTAQTDRVHPEPQG